MATLAEDTARVADAIVAGRGQRSELALAIKSATRRRHGDVRSLLVFLKESRVRAGREQAIEVRKVTSARHSDVLAFLSRLHAARGEATTAQREEAAAFMRDLTSSVAALRDGFVREGRQRAVDVRERLDAYAQERRSALAAWAGILNKTHEKPAAAGSPAGDHPAPAHAAHAAPPIPPSGAAKPADAPAAAAQPEDQQLHRSSSRRVFGHGGPNKPHGGESR